jgi:hypothetical protein
MHGLDIVRMVVSAGASHSFRLPVVRDDVAIVGKFPVADGALPFLLGDFSIQQFAHLGWRTKFTISPRVVLVVDALNTKLKPAFFPSLLATTAEE